MREFLLGVLGSGLTYAVLWYQMTPAVDVVFAAPASARHVASATARKAAASATARKAAASATARKAAVTATAPTQEPRPASHVSRESASGEGALWNDRRPRGELERGASEAFIEPLPAALRKTLERMAELQHISADPHALATRVQAMETNEAELAELKAFAERFVELPQDRVQRYVPSTSGSSAPNNRPSSR